MKYLVENYLAPHNYVLTKEALFKDEMILEFTKENKENKTENEKE